MTTHALVLDPGKTTGVAYVEWGDDQPLRILWTDRTPDGAEGFVRWWLHGLWGRIESLDFIICELFEIDGAITGTWAPQIEGALMALWPWNVTWQRRDEKARLLPDEKRRNAWLKDRGLYAPTQHERDAVTHALVYVAKTLKHRPTLERYWPKPTDNSHTEDRP